MPPIQKNQKPNCGLLGSVDRAGSRLVAEILIALFFLPLSYRVHLRNLRLLLFSA